ncbi:MAG TPA: hypothetical protein VGL28_06780 [Steroidobacteraceae bacterium]|jgi:hypothetical protein
MRFTLAGTIALALTAALGLVGCGLAGTAAGTAAGAASEAQQAQQAKQIEDRAQQQVQDALKQDANRRTQAEKDAQ